MQITQDHLDELEFPKLLSEIAPYAYSPKIAAEILETKPQQIDVAVSLLKKTSEFSVLMRVRMLFPLMNTRT